MIKNAYWGVSLLLFLLCAGIFLLAEAGGKKEYEVVFFGDSIIGDVRDETGIAAQVGELLGVPVYNGAFGGTTASAFNTENRPDMTIDSISLTGLIDALCYENFAVTNAGVESCMTFDYFRETVQGLNDVDWEQVSVIVIEHGVNDYLAGTVLDNPEDPYDTFTYGGALRCALKKLQEEKPELHVVLCTPTYCWFLAEEISCEECDLGGGVLEDYVNLELAIAQEFGVEIVDNYHDSGIGGDFADWSVYTVDGLHLNETGRQILAGRIAAAIADDIE